MQHGSSRREFLKHLGAGLGGAALSLLAAPGTGAAQNALQLNRAGAGAPPADKLELQPPAAAGAFTLTGAARAEVQAASEVVTSEQIYNLPPGRIWQVLPPADLPETQSFNFNTHLATFDPASPPDFVFNWGYNLAPGGTAVRPGETAIGWQLEGHYEPWPGVEYTEAHLFFVDKTNTQQRPIEIRIDKNTNQVVHMINVSEWQARTAKGDRVFATLSPSELRLAFVNTGGRVVHFTGASNAFQIVNEGGGDQPLLMYAGWSYVQLPGAMISRGHAVLPPRLFLAAGGLGEIVMGNVGYVGDHSSLPNQFILASGATPRPFWQARATSTASTVLLLDEGALNIYSNRNLVPGARFNPALRATFDTAGLNLAPGGVYRVGGHQVIGTRGLPIANATGTLADLTGKFNELLERLRAGSGHGLIAR